MEANAAIPTFLSASVIERYKNLSMRQKWVLVGAILAVILVAAWGISYSTSNYKVVADKITSGQDREDIVRVLDQMGIEAKIDGDQISVREDAAGRAAQALARVGLPRTHTSIADAMKQIPFGTTSFHEQVVEAEARQNELAARIEEMDGVRRARVIVHIPKPSVFLRDEQKPSAAVTVYMQRGFSLDKDMVAAVASIVSAVGVPEEDVRVIDGRTGKVVSSFQSTDGLNSSQLEYVEKIKREREEDIVRTLLPITGQGRVSATVNVDVDFSKTDLTSEDFKPNPRPDEAAIRSQHTKEATSPSATTGGIPGALSNQPPGAASAPLVAPAGAASGGTTSNSSASLSAQRESVVNYEVDKTIRHVRSGDWGIKRVTAAVVVNVPADLYDPKNKNAPFKSKDDFEKQVADLIKGAIGYDAKRGDTIQVLNTPFAEEEAIPFWKNQRNIAWFRDVFLINALWVGVVFYLIIGVIRPIISHLFVMNVAAKEEKKAEEEADERRKHVAMREAEEELMRREEAIQEANAVMQRDMDLLDHDLAVVQAMIRQDPRMAAEILKKWMNADE